jgi:transcription elongation factor GreA
MRLPNRKPGKHTFPTFDPQMTAEKLLGLQKKLADVKAALPQAIRETQQYGENGDFSENAEYQIAKGRLRTLNRVADELQYQINHASVIEKPRSGATVHIGHTVMVQTPDTINSLQRFHILGSSETNPAAGIISYQSPLGAALLGHAVGETITLKIGLSTKLFTIKHIA